MDYQLNTKDIPSSKRSFHGRKLQYQERVVEQPNCPPSTTTTLSQTYLTADNSWKTVATTVSSKLGDGQKRQVESNQLKKIFFS